ncbi:hypothetical protein niasHT_015451 [Heterodera trifolii]|uniref:Cytochrome c oxidase assembly factor 3 mitochondrial coiled-coil domain-containing protein n=1 Tax=Heterodera trifolii TaxID=157864 RepID=A0ABD2L0C6_9BILA
MIVNPIRNIFVRNFACQFGHSKLARSYATDGPLTVSGRSAPVKKCTNAADEIARTKFELLEPIAVTDLPRAQQRFARQIHRSNRTRVQKIFAKNIKMIKNGLAGIALVVAIYLYTFFVMRKETFLEEIDEEMAIERGEMKLDDQGRLVAVK